MTAALLGARTLLPAPRDPLATTAPAAVAVTCPAPLPDSAAWGAAEAVLAVVDAGALLGVDLTHPVLVRDVSTVVFRARDLAVKVHPPGTAVDRLEAAYAALAGSPACVLPLHGPVVTGHGMVTVWPWLDRGRREVSWPRIGRLLRELHTTAPGCAALPPWRALSRLPDQVAALSDGQAGVLLAARDRLLLQASELRSDLGWGVIHGDVSTENVLRRGRRPVFIDLDFVAVGPREYDLVGAAMRHEHGELGRRDYAAFCSAYGADVRDWSGLATVRAICELGGLTFAIWAARHAGVELPNLPERIARWT